jgi:hypothetical protein
MKRILGAFGLCMSAALFVGVGSGAGASNHPSQQSSTITHTCNSASSGEGGGMMGDDMDGDGDTISITGPQVLWPPNHKYVYETITATDVDGVSETADLMDGTTLATMASSNQPEFGMGSGHTANDTVVLQANNGSETATQQVKLRAERDGVDPTKAGRTYTIKATAMFDGSTISTEVCHASFTVTVPHDMGHN